MHCRLKPSDVGYFIKGVPDPVTMAELQARYAAAVLDSGMLPPRIMDMFNELQQLATQDDVVSGHRAQRLARDLVPHFHFRPEDVDWEHGLQTPR
jgi:hypothetical protein